MKNNVTRMLDAEKVPYTKLEFSPTITSAPGVAEEVGLPVDQVYKTLVVQDGDGKAGLVMVPGDRDLNLKQLARAIGSKRLRMASQKHAEGLTGLQVGGISPLAVRRGKFPTYIDSQALGRDELCLSAGVRGMNLIMQVEDLLRLTGAQTVSLDN